MPLRRGAAPDEGSGASPNNSAVDGAVDGAALDPARLAGLLAVSDLDQRERNFERVVAHAQRDAAVRWRLAELASTDGSELAWTARLALREVEGGARQAALNLAPTMPAPSSSIRDPFEAMQHRMQAQLERAFGNANPLTPFGGGLHGQNLDELFEGLFGGSMLRGGDPFQMRSPELEQMLEEMGARSVELWRQQGGAPFSGQNPPAAGNSSEFRAHGQSLSITPEGVRLEVTEDGPEGRTTRTYEAPTLEELYAAHPELKGGR